MTENETVEAVAMKLQGYEYRQASSGFGVLPGPFWLPLLHGNILRVMCPRDGIVIGAWFRPGEIGVAVYRK